MPNFNFTSFNVNNLLYQTQQLLRPIIVPGQNPLLGGLFNPNSTAGRSPYMSLDTLFANNNLKLDAQELSTFLKDAMKLPQDMRKLLLMLALESAQGESKKQVQQTLKQLIEDYPQALNISVEDLQKLLGKKSKDGVDKLVKLLQVNQTGETKGAPQVAEMMSTLGKLSEKIQASPKEATETLMLLYIPWYPLAPQQKLEVEFESAGGGEEEAVEECSVVLYLQTASLGRFKLVIQELNPLQIVIMIFHEEQSQLIMGELEDRINDWLAKEGLPAAIFDETLMHPEQIPTRAVASVTDSEQAPEALATANNPATAGFKGATRQDGDQQITLQKGSRVSVLILNCAYALARFVFEADEGNRKLQKSR